MRRYTLTIFMMTFTVCTAIVLFGAGSVLAHPHGAEPIIIGIAPQQEPSKVEAMWKPFLRYLEGEVGHAFAFETAPSIPAHRGRRYSPPL